MFCNQCGNTLPEDAKFCTNCGAQVLNKNDHASPEPDIGARHAEKKEEPKYQETNAGSNSGAEPITNSFARYDLHKVLSKVKGYLFYAIIIAWIGYLFSFYTFDGTFSERRDNEVNVNLKFSGIQYLMNDLPEIKAKVSRNGETREEVNTKKIETELKSEKMNEFIGLPLFIRIFHYLLLLSIILMAIGYFFKKGDTAILYRKVGYVTGFIAILCLFWCNNEFSTIEKRVEKIVDDVGSELHLPTNFNIDIDSSFSIWSWILLLSFVWYIISDSFEHIQKLYFAFRKINIKELE